MRIPCPLCGERDLREFTPWGDAALMHRPGFDAGPEAAHAYLHLRENPAGPHRELSYHELGCAAWLVVTRNTLTHEVMGAALAGEGAEGGA
ncbi:sarcosine oxidase subunit delta [Oceanicella sp. SM1341]|uniref:sarcosine oxidase subunit delta n=1 Tax=Oceanicella sp. SM1341 TaxID=1548889 RepID=UPI000E52C320|nr:sarcosine oxidase subunit delta [Oceanicella sp. SM1341]